MSQDGLFLSTATYPLFFLLKSASDDCSESLTPDTIMTFLLSSSGSNKDMYGCGS